MRKANSDGLLAQEVIMLSQDNNTKHGNGSQVSHKFRSRTIDDMLTKPLPKSEVVVGDDKDIMLVKGARVCTYGKQKAGKSLFNTQFALELGAGGVFLERYKVKRPYNVLYLNFELDEQLFEERTKLIKDALGYNSVPGFRQLTLLGKDIPLLDTPKGYNELCQILDQQREDGFNVEVLILDCRWKTFLYSDSEGEVMRIWLSNVETIQNDYDLIPFIVHHEGKNTTGVGSGSSNFDRWINTAIQIEPLTWESALIASKERRIKIGGNYTGGIMISTVLEYPLHKLADYQIWEDKRTKTEKAAGFIQITLVERGGSCPQQELEEIVKRHDIGGNTFGHALMILEGKQEIVRERDRTKSGHHNIIRLPSKEEISHTVGD